VPPPFPRPSAYAGLWISAAGSAFGRTAIQLALSWITLEVTGSLLMVGAVSAVRMAPQIPFGIPAGIVADWFDRRRLVAGVTVAGSAVALSAAALAASGRLVVPLIMAVAVALGLLDTLRTTATQTYAYDLVRASNVARRLAFVNLGSQLLGTAGGLVGGYTLQAHGGSTTFLVVAIVLAVGAAVLSLATGDAAPALSSLSLPAGQGALGGPSGRSTAAARRKRPSFAAASTLIVRNRLVTVLVLTIILVEVLGFSSMTIMPTFARDVFEVGPVGLGMMTAARSIGGVTSLLLLSRAGTSDRSGAALLGAAGVLGLALLAFSWTSSYPLALVWLALVGGACAVCDTLSQMLLQQSAGEQQRGAAMGLWVFSIGFAPLGHLALGALSDVLGAPPTQAIFGASLAIVAALLAYYAPLRRLA
jgi:MFS family permease